MVPSKLPEMAAKACAGLPVMRRCVSGSVGARLMQKSIWPGSNDWRGEREYVIDWGPGYRIYLARDGEALIILFGGGTKRRQQKDIDQAKALHAEYKDRKKTLAAAKKGIR